MSQPTTATTRRIRPLWIVLVFLMAPVVAVALMVLTNSFGLDSKPDRHASAQPSSYNKTVTDGPVTLNQHWVVGADGVARQDSGPIVTIKSPATVGSLCTAVMAVNNAYPDNEPNSSAVTNQCNTARSAQVAGDSLTCETNLSQLAKGIVGYDPVASLRQPFTQGNLDVACGDSARLKADTASGAAKVSILDASQGE